MAELPVAYQNGTAVPDWLNKGDNSWQMVAATVVGMQSMPGLIILYGSIVKKKWAVNSAFMALYSFAAVLICWVTWAYKMSFGEQLLPFWGKAGPALGQKFLIKQAIVPPIRSRDLPTSSRHSSLQNLNPSRKRTKYSWFLLSETLSSTELTSFEPRTLKMPRALITPWPRQRPEKPRTWVTSSRLGPQHGEPGAGKQHPDRGFHVVS